VELRLGPQGYRRVGWSRIAAAAMVAAGTEQSAELPGDIRPGFLTPFDS